MYQFSYGFLKVCDTVCEGLSQDRDMLKSSPSGGHMQFSQQEWCFGHAGPYGRNSLQLDQAATSSCHTDRRVQNTIPAEKIECGRHSAMTRSWGPAFGTCRHLEKSSPEWCFGVWRNSLQSDQTATSFLHTDRCVQNTTLAEKVAYGCPAPTARSGLGPGSSSAMQRARL